MTDTSETQNMRIRIPTLESVGIAIPNDEYDSTQDRCYVRKEHPKANVDVWHTAWSGPLHKATTIPYFCPSGWRRFALKVDMPRSFWENSSNMYHGTDPINIPAILQQGFRTTQCQHAGKAAYLTPSIRYAGHPRYAKIYHMDGFYYQFILQVRVENRCVKHWKEAVAQGPGFHKVTLPPPEPAPEGRPKPPRAHAGTDCETMNVGDRERIDRNFESNEHLEFLYMSEKEHVTAADGLVVTGIMVRCLAENPIGRAENSWWLYWCRLVAEETPPETFLNEDFVVHR